ncbi:MAG TPA: sigma-54-dependent Fis family transcriptional regulator, partial [Deltaproteobacteria bacterium]|nr:sigma-54-dependent Fis family transcriptional regulator [Deltaproteobacteria bacterium]
ESGTGKELIAHAIHRNSYRKNGPFIKVSCAVLAENLLESELFGHEKGAFTGANTEKRGYIALADGGTLFLDEISDMPIGCQSKLLTFLDSMKYRPLGAVKERTSKVRIISSSNQPLWEMVKTGNFREDLFFRISVVRLFIPPLRERKEDIPGIINNFLNHKKHIGAQAMKLLLSHIWPGNIRELFSTLESACICSAENETLQPEHIGLDYDKTHVYTESKKPKDEKLEIMQALKKSSNNKSLAAQFLGMSRITLWRRIKKYGIGVDENSCDETCSCHRL